MRARWRFCKGAMAMGMAMAHGDGIWRHVEKDGKWQRVVLECEIQAMGTGGTCGSFIIAVQRYSDTAIDGAD